jgi:hypothetical protein
MSIDSADSTGNVLRRDPPSLVRGPAVECEGCRERTARIEQLERRIEELEDGSVSQPNFAATRCYWICLATHAVITLGLFLNPYTIQIGIVTTIGFLGTLSACHGLSTRSLPARLWRTVVALTVVIGSAMIATSMQGGIDVSEMALMILFYLVPMLLTGWFVAKIFVWTRGWRLVPPGGTSESAKLQIRHLMIWTFVVAVLLTAGRLAVGDQTEVFEGDVLVAVLWAAVPAVVSTLIGCVLARILLSRSNRKLVRKLFAFAAVSLVLVVGTYFAVLGAMGEISADGVDLQSFVIISLYVVFAVFGLMASPVFTFVMMRTANYRMIHP